MAYVNEVGVSKSEPRLRAIYDRLQNMLGYVPHYFQSLGAKPEVIEAQSCNCSICEKTGFVHIIVPKSRFRLLEGQAALTSYQFNTATARHLFCSICGVKSFYVPRSHPDGYSVNARCLDDGSVTGMDIERVDGKNWEQQYPQGRGRPFEELR